MMSAERLKPGALDKKLTMTAAAFAALLNHTEPAFSAEIPPDASWSEGIEALQKGVILEEAESVVWYLKGEREQWFSPPTVGESDVRLYEGNPVKYLQRNYDITMVCEMHDHVLETFLRAQEEGYAPPDPSPDSIHAFREQFEHGSTASLPPIDAPPSDGDISIKRHDILRAQIETGLGHYVEIRHGVKTLQGIWYWDFLPSAQNLQGSPPGPVVPRPGEPFVSQESPQSLQRGTMLEYMEALKTERDVVRARDALINVYEQSFGVKVRFVPNAEIENEPSCAGANYQFSRF